jgi:hypothetical protein
MLPSSLTMTCAETLLGLRASQDTESPGGPPAVSCRMKSVGSMRPPTWAVGTYCADEPSTTALSWTISIRGMFILRAN